MKQNIPLLCHEFVNNIIMAALDEKGNYIYVSPQWEATRRVNACDVIGHNVLELVPDSKAMECIKTGQTIRGELVELESYPVFTTYIPRFDKENKLCGVFLYSIFEGAKNTKELIRELTALASEVDFYKEELSKERGAKYSLDNIIGASPSIMLMKERIIKASRSASTVLIEGETGTGKELIAHSIHTMSARRSKNFVRVNCAAIPGGLMESEFFGYMPGAFTGALKRGKIGRFELADKGTLFLDEVNLLTPTIQPKFLRVLQEMEIDPVGSENPKHIDVRIIAATNVSLEQQVQSGRFRSDLYYRFNVIRIVAPPLREHREDIPILTNNLIQRLNQQLGMNIEGAHPNVLELFSEYNWPGNVRELQNVIEAAMNITTSSVLQTQDFGTLLQRINSPHYRAASDYGLNLRKAKKNFEASFVREALIIADGNRTKAAGLLGISRTELYNKIGEYGL